MLPFLRCELAVRLRRLFGKNPTDQDVFSLPTASARPNGYRTPSRPSFSGRAQKTTGIAFTKKTIARYKNGYIESFNGKLRDELLAVRWQRDIVKAFEPVAIDRAA